MVYNLANGEVNISNIYSFNGLEIDMIEQKISRYKGKSMSSDSYYWKIRFRNKKDRKSVASRWKAMEVLHDRKVRDAIVSALESSISLSANVEVIPATDDEISGIVKKFRTNFIRNTMEIEFGQFESMGLLFLSMRHCIHWFPAHIILEASKRILNGEKLPENFEITPRDAMDAIYRR